MKGRKVIVVGASRGIGAEIVRQLARQGAQVGALGRDEQALGSLANEFPGAVIPITHDVTHTSEIADLFVRLTGELSGLDVFIYVAGVMPRVDVTEFSTEKDSEMVEVNLMGAIAWLNEAAARFQGARRGTIAAIGSVAGDRGRHAQPVYNATKAGLATYLEALRNRLSRLGVRVTTIKPGPVATEMTRGLDLPKAMSAEQAARIIVRNLDRGTEVYLSPVHRLIFAVIRIIPSRIIRRLKI